MLDCKRILNYLLHNPPKLPEEQRVHASLLEVVAQLMRSKEPGIDTSIEVTDNNKSRFVEAEIYTPPPKLKQSNKN